MHHYDIKFGFNKVATTFSALRSRNYRLYMFGMLFSVIGIWVQNVALGWLVYRLTGDVLLLGIVAFAGQIPSIVVTPIAGVYADRMNRRRMIIFTQAAAMVLAFLLAILIFANYVEVWHLIVISILNGIFNSIDTPFRHAFVREMVEDKSQMQNAIALNSTLFNTARFIGPTIGGLLIAAVGEGWCFFANGLSYLAVIVSLLMMKMFFVKKEHSNNSIMKDLLDGFKYCYKDIPMRYLLMIVVSSGLLCLPFQTFLPVYAKDFFSASSELYGFMTGAYGMGALVGAIFLATRKSVKSLPQIILLASVLFTFSLMFFSVSPWKTATLISLVFAGFGMITQYTSVNTMLQTISDPDKVGRVVSLYGMSFMAITPLGTIFLSYLSNYFDIRYVLFVSIALSLLFVAIYAIMFKKILWVLRKKHYALFVE